MKSTPMDNYIFRFFVKGHNVRVLLGNSPRAVLLDSQVVSVHLDAEEAGLSPVGSPTVTADPELNSVLFTPPDNCNLVVDLRHQFGL